MSSCYAILLADKPAGADSILQIIQCIIDDTLYYFYVCVGYLAHPFVKRMVLLLISSFFLQLSVFTDEGVQDHVVSLRAFCGNHPLCWLLGTSVRKTRRFLKNGCAKEPAQVDVWLRGPGIGRVLLDICHYRFRVIHDGMRKSYV